MRGPWSLRRRLLLALVVVTAVVTLTVGATSVVLLRSFLVDRLDEQLTSAVQRSSDGQFGPPGTRGVDDDDDGPGPDGTGDEFGFLQRPGQAEGTLGAQVSGGEVVQAGVLTRAGNVAPLDERASTVVAGVSSGDGPRTADVPGLGPYRLLAVDLADGSTLVTGLPEDDIAATSARLLVILLGATAAGCVVVLLAGGRVVRRAMRPLAQVTATATRVRLLDLSAGDGAVAERVPDHIARTPDEVGDVASTLNLMLDHVEDALLERHRSETRIRQFVADASHELRTPLASIRGYAELMRRRPEPLPDDLVHALGRVESEAERMGGLVEDLLLLARLDAGRPLELHPLDLVPVVVSALADAHAAGPDHRWTLDLSSQEPIVVRGEPARLQQVVANLLGNARVHTPPGTTVTVSLTVEGVAALLSVADDGPGVPEVLHPTVFERFARGDSSRSRRAGSTGLGLSIAAAVVHAHGGEVECLRVSTGAVFVVRLPLAGAGSRGADAAEGASSAAGSAATFA